MNNFITQSMVLAAGLGKRLRPLTDVTPKPLIPVGGTCMLDRVLNHLLKAGIQKCVVNTHHLAEQIHNHLSTSPIPTTLISHEKELLETGGGICKALPNFEGTPFFSVNADIWWEDHLSISGEVTVFDRLQQVWNPEHMDALLLLIPKDHTLGYTGSGDFFIDHPTGLLEHRGNHNTAPFIYGGIQLLHPRLFDNISPSPFSIVSLYQRAEKNQRLYGIIYEGLWGDIGTLEALAQINAFLEEQEETSWRGMKI
jgi:MurNAc alpha-1-phosphate uridylyltransferase